MAGHLSSRPVAAVWSSPLERALRTAEAIAAKRGLTVRVDPELTEWRMADRWAGIRWDDLPGRRPGELEAYLSDPTRLPFAAESLEELAARMGTVLVGLHDRHRQGDVVVVGHQDPLQAARLALTGRPLDGLLVGAPAHAAVISLRPGTPWEETARWQPDQDPLQPDQNGEG
ncbi:MAG: histidine phosphatase family protein [Acidimicrobiia bacterium]